MQQRPFSRPMPVLPNRTLIPLRNTQLNMFLHRRWLITIPSSRLCLITSKSNPNRCTSSSSLSSGMFHQRRHLDITLFGRNYHFTRRWFIRWFFPRFVLWGWGLTFLVACAYVTKKNIDTEGFTCDFNPGEGGDVGKEDWVMMGDEGELITKQDLCGKYSLMYFGFTFCPDVCPIEMKKLAAIADIFEKRGILNRVHILFVSVDYRRDSPAVVKKYCRQYSDKIKGICGNKEQMSHFAKVMKTYFSRPPELEEDYVLEHSTYIYFTDRDAEFKQLTNTEDSPAVLADKVSLWIAEEDGWLPLQIERFKQIFR